MKTKQITYSKYDIKELLKVFSFFMQKYHETPQATVADIEHNLMLQDDWHNNSTVLGQAKLALRHHFISGSDLGRKYIRELKHYSDRPMRWANILGHFQHLVNDKNFTRELFYRDSLTQPLHNAVKVTGQRMTGWLHFQIETLKEYEAQGEKLSDIRQDLFK